jgi:psiF repeat
MLRALSVLCLLPLLLLASPASALTKAQKMETCKFGADDQKLTGAKRKSFLAKCMSNRNDKRGAMKLPAKKPAPKKTAAKKPAMKKPMTKPAAAAPADAAPAPKQ